MGSRSREQHTQNGCCHPLALRGGFTTAVWWRMDPWLGLFLTRDRPCCPRSYADLGGDRVVRAGLCLEGQVAMVGARDPHPHGHISCPPWSEELRCLGFPICEGNGAICHVFRGLLVTNIPPKAPHWAMYGSFPHVSSSSCPSVFSSVQRQQTHGDTPLDELPPSAGERTEIGAERPFFVVAWISAAPFSVWHQLHLAGFAHFQFSVNTSPGSHLGSLHMLIICSWIIIIFLH